MGKQTKRQHYIPRCYLKWFSAGGKSIYAYDKKLSKAYDAPMMSVCFENNLYTISDEFVARNNAEAGKSEINRLTIERDFSERIFSTVSRMPRPQSAAPHRHRTFAKGDAPLWIN